MTKKALRQHLSHIRAMSVDMRAVAPYHNTQRVHEREFWAYVKEYAALNERRLTP